MKKEHENASKVCPPHRFLFLLLLLLRASRSSSSQSRPGDYERCDMRARYYEGAVGRAGTCISGSRCVTRLIKIPRDLLRQAHAAARNGARKRKKEKEREGAREKRTRGTDTEWTDAEEERRRRRVRATHSTAALSSTHVVSTQFAMKYRSDHRPCADDHNGLPALNRLPHATSAFAVLHLDLSLAAAPFLLSFVLSRSPLPTRDIRISSRAVSRSGEKSALSNEEKFIRGASHATMALIRLNSNMIVLLFLPVSLDFARFVATEII